MKRKRRTDTAAYDESVWHTRWTEISAARTLDPARRRKAVGRVMDRYWKCVYAYLRHKGNGHDVASDLVQGFFVKVLQRELIQQADAKKGRFRTYLLTALDRYVRDEHEKRSAKKRRPPGGVASLDAMEQLPPLPDAVRTPEQAYTYAWALQLLDEVLADVEAQCRQARQQPHWEVFRRTVVEPTLSGAQAPTMQALCEELGSGTAKRTAAMNVTVKRRFRRILRAHVAPHVASEDDIDAEIRELMALLSNRNVGK